MPAKEAVDAGRNALAKIKHSVEPLTVNPEDLLHGKTGMSVRIIKP